jgi:hypothetical protein
MISPNDILMDNSTGHESALLLQQTWKEYFRGENSIINAEKMESIEQIAMATQTDEVIAPSVLSSIAPVMGPWTDSHPILRVLLIFSNPSNTHPLRLQAEEKCIRDALRGGKYGERVVIDVLPACTIDDLARQLMSHSYEIIHFSGHADRSSALVKHTMGVLVGEHNVEFTNFKDAEVLKKLESAAEEVVRQLEIKLMQVGCCHCPADTEIKLSGESIVDSTFRLQQSIIMHGKLHGEKTIHSSSSSHFITHVAPHSTSTGSTRHPSAEPKSPDRACSSSENAFSAVHMHEHSSALSTDHQELAILNISKLQVRLKPRCCTPGTIPASPSSSTATSTTTSTDSTSPFSGSGSGSPISGDGNGDDAYGEVNVVKHFSLRDLLEIGNSSHIAFLLMIN